VIFELGFWYGSGKRFMNAAAAAEYSRAPVKPIARHELGPGNATITCHFPEGISYLRPKISYLRPKFSMSAAQSDV
jgi:hypothetical protein